jgi:hypothetical protein
VRRCVVAMDKKKVKSVRGRTADVVLRVCEVLMSGEASSKVEAYAVVGKEFGVLPKTVKSAYYRHGKMAVHSPGDFKDHGLALFTTVQEAALAGILHGLYACDHPPTYGTMLEIVRLWGKQCGLDKQRCNGIPRSWVQRFVKRHPDLITPRQAQGLADKRKTQNVKESVQRFVAMLERHIGPHADPKSAWCWQPHVVVNADETRFGYSDESTLVLAPKNAGKVSTPVYRDPTTLTVVHPQAAAP